VTSTATSRPWSAASLRAHFLFVLILSLAVGGALYAIPSLGPSIWPYPMKSLATRFFASVFLAVAVASGFALQEKARAPMRVLLVMGASVFGLILLAAAADASRFTLGALGVALWVLLFAALSLFSLILLLRSRRDASVDGPPVPRWLRAHFLLHTVVVLFFATPMLVAPSFEKQFWPWTVSDPIMRGIGGLFIGVALGTAWCWRQRSWDRVRLLLPVNVTFVSAVLLAVAIHWNVIASESPGWHVTAPWLLLYVYTALYPAYYLLRPPAREAGALQATPADDPRTDP